MRDTLVIQCPGKQFHPNSDLNIYIFCFLINIKPVPDNNPIRSSFDIPININRPCIAGSTEAGKDWVSSWEHCDNFWQKMGMCSSKLNVSVSEHLVTIPFAS